VSINQKLLFSNHPPLGDMKSLTCSPPSMNTDAIQFTDKCTSNREGLHPPLTWSPFGGTDNVSVLR
jgi:hypothetical protein